jgi:hypothetical protein
LTTERLKTGRALLLLAALLSPAGASAAQSPSALAVGTRVRVSADTGRSITGLLLAVPADSIGLRPCPGCGPMSVSLGRVKRIDVSDGKHLSIRNTVVGGLLGMVVGAGVGAWIGDASCSRSCGVAAVIPGLTGAGLGLVMGSAGGLAVRRESWRQVFP